MVRSSSRKIDVIRIQGGTIADRSDARAVDVKITNTHVHRGARAPSRQTIHCQRSRHRGGTTQCQRRRRVDVKRASSRDGSIQRLGA